MKLNWNFLLIPALVAVTVPSYGQSSGVATGAPSDANISGGIEEIVVTAQRREENQQNVPIAVSAVSGSTLGRTGVGDLTDLSLAVPTLYLTNSDGFLTSTLRGVGTNAIGPGFENTVALYIDGVYLASAASSLLSLHDIAQVEVLKGPQGTLFGRNATAGLIQITTRAPTQTPEAEVNLSYGNYQTSSVNAYVSGGISPMLAANLAVEYAHQNQGWGTDLQNGRNVYQVTHDAAVRSKWLFTPLDGTKFTVIGDYSSAANTMNALHTIPGTINGFAPALGRAPELGYNVNTDYPSFINNNSAGVSLRWDQDLSILNFATISAYRKFRSNVDFDYDGSPQNIESIAYTEFERQFSQEFQLQSKPGSPFIWVAGAYYFNSNSAYAPFDLFANDFGANIRVLNQQKAKSFAGYAQGTYEIVQNTNLTLGGRYTTETRTAYNGSTNVFVVPLALQLPPILAPDAEAKFNKFTFRASLDHRFNDELFSYLSFNRGFKAGGFNTGSPGTRAYEPETLDAYELGIKTDLLNRRLRVNAAAFYYNYKNIQIQQLNLGAITIINGASAHIYGLDLDAVAQVTDQFRLTAALGLSHPDFKSFPDCPISVPSGGVPSGIGSCAGNQLPLSSKITATIAGEYTVPLPKGSLVANGNVYFNDGFYTEADNVYHQPSYAELGAQLHWTAPGDHFTLGVYGKNLTDRRVINFETTIPNGTHTGFYQEPRTYGVTAGYKY
jgi:iron complex outermembrane receptor protein